MTTSLLGRLWAYAQDPLVAPLEGHNRPLENFTTEALAGAIRRDPRPFLEALALKGIGGRPRGSVATVLTQVAVPTGRSTRYLDLVVRLERPPAAPTDVWFENKVNAPVSGLQLLAYRQAKCAAAKRDGVERYLVWLAAGDPSADVQRYIDRSLRWQDLADAVHIVGVDWLWIDLVAFLEENDMTQDRTYPISAREATILEDAQRLFIKTHPVLRTVNDWARTAIPEWDGSRWWSTGAVKGALLERLAARGELVLTDGTTLPVWLEYGVATRRDEAWFVARVVAKSPRDQTSRAIVLEALRPLHWDEPGGPVIVEDAARAIAFASDDDAIAWFEGRLRDLQRAGFFRLALTLSGPGPIPAGSLMDPNSAVPGASSDGEPHV